ncbi:MAG: EAL domain-containing protein [Geminicoccaceae bacterium]|nr:EAL domain-containing protein [Geminicoccaceae bacterium]MCB9943766.1 EAL domain-containing protein [Geminicoccaceae bacterium]
MAKIVVIDDRVTNRNILTRLALSVEEGLQVQSFSSPVDALSRLHGQNIPDLIITDYNMPEMDGAAFIATLRENPDFADIPIVVVTVYEDREFCYRALEAGATDFLLSPVDHLEFRARARNLLTIRRQQKLLAERAVDLERALRDRNFGVTDTQNSVQSMFDALPMALDIVDRHGRLVAVNSAHEKLFEISRDAAVGRHISRIYGESHATRHSVHNEKVFESGRALAAPVRDIVDNGDSHRDLIAVKGPFIHGNGHEEGVMTLSVDVTDLVAETFVNKTSPSVDLLTQLPSFESFNDRAEMELARARRQHEMLAILIIDIDRFKGINDAFGRDFADELLRSVAGRLSKRLRETDYLARLRSDEFVVMQMGLKRPDDAAELARRLSEAFAEPFLIDHHEVHISASTGITLFPADGRNIETLLKNADLAVYRAKASGRDGYRFFAAEMNIAARRAVTLERELRQAIAGEQFLVYYQPQVELTTGRIIGMEALVRWNHPHRGIVRPGEFIGLAEDIGIIAPLTAWVLRTACAQHRVWRDKGMLGMQLSVNLSPVQFRERGVELMVERILKDTQLDASSLDIELTENAVIENSQTASASLRYLNQLGVSLSIDDFGTGYSSLAYVKRLPVQRLKIDQSFVQNIDQSTNDEVIVRAIINLGHSLGLRVIAEGVETAAQLESLKELGCDEVQGDYMSPPVDAVTFERQMCRDGDILTLAKPERAI